MNTKEKTIPSLGSDRITIYREWERLDNELNGPPLQVVGWVVGYGLFGFLHGTIIRLYPGYGKKVPTYEIAGKDDLEELDRSILNGTFQVEVRPVGKAAESSFSTWVYHQATGRKLVEKLV